MEAEASDVGVVFIIGFRNSEEALTGYVSDSSEFLNT